MTRYGYDITEPLAIENFAKQLEGKCLADFMANHSVDVENKGTFGNLVQTFLGYNSSVLLQNTWKKV